MSEDEDGSTLGGRGLGRLSTRLFAERDCVYGDGAGE